ncbi:MAG: hypothetical protein R2818_08085 [Flavobacteriales bacterium]
MNDTNGSNDPLSPVYQHDPGRVRPVKRIGSLGSKQNLAVLIVIAAVLLALFALVGGSEEEQVPAEPVPTEVQ